MALFLQCESTESSESLNQRRDGDYFVVSFEGERIPKFASSLTRRNRKLAEIDGPTLIEVISKCPVG
jgi:hypothetical protein